MDARCGVSRAGRWPPKPVSAAGEAGWFGRSHLPRSRSSSPATTRADASTWQPSASCSMTGARRRLRRRRIDRRDARGAASDSGGPARPGGGCGAPANTARRRRSPPGMRAALDGRPTGRVPRRRPRRPRRGMAELVDQRADDVDGILASRVRCSGRCDRPKADPHLVGRHLRHVRLSSSSSCPCTTPSAAASSSGRPQPHRGAGEPFVTRCGPDVELLAGCSSHVPRLWRSSNDRLVGVPLMSWAEVPGSSLRAASAASILSQAIRLRAGRLGAAESPRDGPSAYCPPFWT